MAARPAPTEMNQDEAPPPSYESLGYGQGQPPPPPGGTHVVYTQQPTNNAVISFRDTPVAMTCQFCQASVTTSTTFDVGVATWIVCFVIAFMGLWCGCCLIPFCMNDAKDVFHMCPNCGQTVGKFARLF